jgi:hypothetical protein
VFAANALLDAYEWTQCEECLAAAASTADFIADRLFWSNGSSVQALAYPLSDSRIPVHNANYLGAALLARVFRYSRRQVLADVALAVTNYSNGRQRQDGSWEYGESETWRWIDSFHTGYNLCALREISMYLEIPEFMTVARAGYAFYKQSFFESDAAPKYFNNRLYPIDIHSAAQGILTLIAFRRVDADGLGLANQVYEWTVKNMRHRRGYFYYQKNRTHTTRIPYMRWSQAWMLLALTSLLEVRSCALQANDSIKSLHIHSPTV